MISSEKKSTEENPQDLEEKNLSLKATSTRQLIKRIISGYLSDYKIMLSAAVFCMMLAALMTGALAKMMEPLVNQIFTDKNEAMIWPVASGIFFAFLLRGFATYGHTVLMNKIGQTIVARIQSDLFGHMLSFELNFFHQNPSGQLISRVVNDVSLMRQAVAETFTSMGKGLLTLIVLVAVMFYEDWQLSLAAFFVFPLSAIAVARVGGRLRKVSSNTQEKLADFSSTLNQSFQGIRQVKAYGMEKYEKKQARQYVENLYRLVHKAVRVSALTTPMTEVLTGFAMVAVVVYGGQRVIEGTLTTGSLFAFITAFMLAYDPIKRLSRLNNSLQMGLAAADRVFSMMDRVALIQDKSGAEDLVLKEPIIEFDQVTFHYPDQTIALDNVSFTIPAGKTAALVGASGAGKTTILNLIPRFYDVQKGTVKVGGVDVRDVRRASLLSCMALVSQEVSIFNDTVRANIAYGKFDASDEEIEQAARKAAAHDFIKQLPKGYDTVLGEQGVSLSGGQRQRIAIARAMVRNAPILLLDEATSALDTKSERAVQEALSVLQKDRTTLIIAHRLSTIVNADLICVLDQGKIIEQGTHKELMKKKGLYTKLHDLQQTAA